MNTFSKATAILLLAAVATLPVAAQLSVTVEDVSVPEAARQTVTFDSVAIGQRATKRLYLRFDAGGSRTVVLDRIQIVGTNQFSVETDDTLPVTLRNEFRYAILVHYEPSTPGPAYGQLQVTTEREDDDTGVVTKLSSVNLVGRVPDFSLRYSLPGGPPIAVPTGGIIDFGRKSTNIATEATVVVTNVGSVAGTVQSIRLTGGAFRFVSPPSIPFRLAAGQEQILQLAFTPTATRGFSGQMTLDWGGTPRVVDVTGIGGDLLSYRLVTYARGSASGAPRDIKSGTSIVFGQNAHVIELIGRNAYANAQSVEAARITGPFTFAVRPSLPATLGPREEFVVQLSPARTARGSDTGTLTIGDAIFPLSLDVPAMPPVRYSRQGGAVSAVQDIPLGLSLATSYPVDIAGTLTLDFRGSAQGAAAVAWATGGRTAQFTIPAGQRAAVFPGGSTSLPFQSGVTAGEISVQARFTADPWGIDITPINVPELRFSVDIDPLPTMQFSREGGTVGAGESVSLGLSLAAPYGSDLVGALVLGVSGNDPSVAWATGGREATFRIAAGAREATFAGGSAAMSFNAGGSAGEIMVRARLSTENPRVDVTPATAPELRFTVDLVPLPAVQFSREGGTVGAGESVSLGLSLAAPYGSDLVGALVLGVSGNDPSVAWATGGREATFRIAAGAREATFAGGASAMSFNAGGSAGEIAVRARFSMDSPRVNVTPATPPELRFTVDLAPLPAVQFSREGGTVGAGESVSLGLSLAAPYGSDLVGALVLGVSGNDPSVAWATGGREARFRISAGAREATFDGGLSTMSFNTGGSAGEIVLRARFSMDSPRVEITPATPPELRFTVDLAPLPEVRFSRAGGTVSAGQEITLGLSLAEPYGSELSGTLQLRSPAGAGVGWVAGGAEARFTIPAGQTVAAFSGGASEVTFRTGRVEGWASVQARFATEPAQVDVTPASVPELRFSVELDPLPEVVFSEAGGTASGGGQIPLGLTLAKPYPTDIAGFLELRFETRAFTTDPAIQWASGGRLAAFGIPAGSTEAAFLDLGTTNAFQTGTVAGDIVVTAQLYSVPDVLAITTLAQAQAVAADITPSTAPQVRFRVLEGAPVLSRLDLGTTGQGRFNLQITGHATTRSVESMSFAFSGTAGSLLRTPELEADVSQAFTTFYGSNQSASFGSQFTATVQFSLDEGVFEDVAQVTVTAANSEGTSNSVTLNLN